MNLLLDLLVRGSDFLQTLGSVSALQFHHSFDIAIHHSDLAQFPGLFKGLNSLKHEPSLLLCKLSVLTHGIETNYKLLCSGVVGYWLDFRPLLYSFLQRFGFS